MTLLLTLMKCSIDKMIQFNCSYEHQHVIHNMMGFCFLKYLFTFSALCLSQVQPEKSFFSRIYTSCLGWQRLEREAYDVWEPALHGLLVPCCNWIPPYSCIWNFGVHSSSFALELFIKSHGWVLWAVSCFWFNACHLVREMGIVCNVRRGCGWGAMDIKSAPFVLPCMVVFPK